ncbi:MAG: hypothetical protein GX552_00090 [Chloroflexi bacterium]|jgi:hypothetical protein|nr:hypothetical protein [Chloroflexota bacterium]
MAIKVAHVSKRHHLEPDRPRPLQTFVVVGQFSRRPHVTANQLFRALQDASFYMGQEQVAQHCLQGRCEAGDLAATRPDIAIPHTYDHQALTRCARVYRGNADERHGPLAWPARWQHVHPVIMEDATT